jgi:hypothetical protein
MLRTEFAIDSYLVADDTLHTDLLRQLHAVEWAEQMLGLFVQRSPDLVGVGVAAAAAA